MSVSRLTKGYEKHNNEFISYVADSSLYPEMMGYEQTQAEMDAINKLGQLEDLLEKYQINDIEELELIIGKNLQDSNKLYPIPVEDLKEYRIDKCGNVYSLKNKIYLKYHKNKQGYTYYMINGKQRLMHRLVAITFIPNPNNYKEINHKNETKYDNRVENLEWCSRQYNSTYNNCHLRHNDWEKKPVLQFDLQGNFIKEWSYAKEIEKSGIAKSNLVKQCCRNQLCQTSNYVWRFKGDTFETRRTRKEYDRAKNLGNYARKQKI